MDLASTLNAYIFEGLGYVMLYSASMLAAMPS